MGERCRSNLIMVKWFKQTALLGMIVARSEGFCVILFYFQQNHFWELEPMHVEVHYKNNINYFMVYSDKTFFIFYFWKN